MVVIIDTPTLAKLLARAKIFVEYLPQMRIEGDMQALAPDAPATEHWQVVTGRARGRAGPADITIFGSVGFAREHYSALRYVYEQPQAHRLGASAALVPEPRGPRDLYGYVTGLAVT